ncbi:kinase-like domain-containing protein [Mycena sanguinolenta]|nr:kinase-like domain-containing protein [Mycena sanguinolenta]
MSNGLLNFSALGAVRKDRARCQKLLEWLHRVRYTQYMELFGYITGYPLSRLCASNESPMFPRHRSQIKRLRGTRPREPTPRPRTWAQLPSHMENPNISISKVTITALRLKREVNIWSNLKHPNILGVYDIGTPLSIFLHPFCRFGHIGNYLKTHLGEAPRMHGIAVGLQYLHNNVVHGDLKMTNVPVDKCRIPNVRDFGVSQIVGEAGFTTYLAPELFVPDTDMETPQLEPHPTKCSDVYFFAYLALDVPTPSSPPAKMGTPIVSRKDLAAFRIRETPPGNFRTFSGKMPENISSFLSARNVAEI